MKTPKRIENINYSHIVQPKTARPRLKMVAVSFGVCGYCLYKLLLLHLNVDTVVACLAALEEPFFSTLGIRIAYTGTIYNKMVLTTTAVVV